MVVDASALVDLLQGERLGVLVGARLRGTVRHAPAHVDAEILSALGRSSRGGELTDSQVAVRLGLVASMPLLRHPLPPLLQGAWSLRENVRLVDALYVELAEQLGVRLITTDHRLARVAPIAEVVSAQG